MRKIDAVAAALVIVGALNWGLVAIAKFDLVAAVFGLDFGETNAATLAEAGHDAAAQQSDGPGIGLGVDLGALTGGDQGLLDEGADAERR